MYALRQQQLYVRKNLNENTLTQCGAVWQTDRRTDKSDIHMCRYWVRKNVMSKLFDFIKGPFFTNKFPY